MFLIVIKSSDVSALMTVVDQKKKIFFLFHKCGHLQNHYYRTATENSLSNYAGCFDLL